ncbi:MAG: hypothetical protein ACRD1X_17970 [Vicinamibacteria bacterium]
MILYRASSSEFAGRDNAFTPDLEVAVAYVNNKGFGGPRIYAYRVGGDRETVLDLYAHDHRKERVALAREIRPREDPYAEGSVYDRWQEQGYVYMHDLLLDAGVADELRALGFLWVTFTDDYPEDAETWWYLGDELLEGVKIPKSQWPDVPWARFRVPAAAHRRWRSRAR